ncbi:MAG: nitroreductase family protein [Myxococcota bacterium]|nr:nitroreductase family protein [Myxococcota bacterium]
MTLEIDELLATTRSVRKRLDFDRPVSRDVIERCLELGLQAPNGSNLNAWRWIVIDDPACVEAAAALYNRGLDDFIESLGQAVGENYAGSAIPGYERISVSVDYLRENLHRCPALLVPLLPGRVEGLDVFFQASQWGSIVQAVWSFMLALRSRGLGSAWTTGHLLREREMAELLGVPFGHYTQVGLFPIAYTLGTDFKPAYRKPLSEILGWNGFASETETQEDA